MLSWIRIRFRCDCFFGTAVDDSVWYSSPNYSCYCGNCSRRFVLVAVLKYLKLVFFSNINLGSSFRRCASSLAYTLCRLDSSILWISSTGACSYSSRIFCDENSCVVVVKALVAVPLSFTRCPCTRTSSVVVEPTLLLLY